MRGFDSKAFLVVSNCVEIVAGWKEEVFEVEMESSWLGIDFKSQFELISSLVCEMKMEICQGKIVEDLFFKFGTSCLARQLKTFL